AAQYRDGIEEAFALLRILELLRMGDEAAGLAGEQEVRRASVAPCRQGLPAWQPVEGVVQFHRPEVAGIPVQERRRAGALRVERTDPVGVVPAGGSDVDRTACHARQRPPLRRSSRRVTG